MSQEKGVSYADFEQLKEKVEWTEIHGAAALTRKTMWFVKKGCRLGSVGEVCGEVWEVCGLCEEL